MNFEVKLKVHELRENELKSSPRLYLSFDRVSSYYALDKFLSPPPLPLPINIRLRQSG